jgi:hypothetical protein
VVVFIASTVAVLAALFIGSAKAHRSKRVAVCMAILLAVAGGFAGLCSLYVALLAWPAR